MGKRKKKKHAKNPSSSLPVVNAPPPPPPPTLVPAPIVAATPNSPPAPVAGEPAARAAFTPATAEAPVGFGWVIAGLVAAALASLAIFNPTPPAVKNTPGPTAQNTALPPAQNTPPTPTGTPAKEELSESGEVLSREVATAVKLDDPRKDGWDTEVFSDAAGTQIKHLCKLLADPGRIDPAHLAEFLAPEFRTTDLRPRKLDQVFQDGALTVLRDPDNGTQRPGGVEFSGASGLADTFAALREPFHDAKGVQTYFKIFRVNPDPETKSVETLAYFEASGPRDGGYVQINATWRCTLLRSDDNSPPRLTGLALEDYEEIVTRTPQHTLFADCTEAILGKNDSFQRQLRPGMTQWVDQLDFSSNPQGNSEIGFRGGVAVGDVNGDGLEDIYVCQAGGLPNRLYVQNPDGTATDRSAEAGVDWMERTNSALFLDLDNDGDQDLVIATVVGLVIMENDGTGKFTLRSVLHPQLEDVQSICAADFNGDGLLDIYMPCDFLDRDGHPDLPWVPFNYINANDAAPNYLFRNDGGWAFTDVTKEVGLGQNNRKHSLAAMWEDYDNDGDQDLFVSNDFGRKNLYRNDGGKFVDVAAAAGVEDTGSGMSVTWGDYNNDGNMDLYVSDMWSSAAGRITYQPKWEPHLSKDEKSLFQRMGRGNSLLRNRGDGTFEDVTETAGVINGRWSWGSNFMDVNNDGFEDLFVANGYFTGSDPKDL